MYVIVARRIARVGSVIGRSRRLVSAIAWSKSAASSPPFPRFHQYFVLTRWFRVCPGRTLSCNGERCWSGSLSITKRVMAQRNRDEPMHRANTGWSRLRAHVGRGAARASGVADAVRSANQLEENSTSSAVRDGVADRASAVFGARRSRPLRSRHFRQGVQSPRSEPHGVAARIVLQCRHPCAA